MTTTENLNLLQFDEIIKLVKQHCYSFRAKELCDAIAPSDKQQDVITLLEQTNEIKNILSANQFFPSIEHEDVYGELSVLKLEGGFLNETQLLKVLKTSQVIFTLVKFLKSKKASSQQLYALSIGLETPDEVITQIEKVIDFEGQVKSNASSELNRIRVLIKEKRKESDRKFYNCLNDLRKLGYLRENAEEGYFSGRRTIAVMADYKSEVSGFVHSKSESGKTVFIEPGITIEINNELAELEIDERREINRILRELCAFLHPFAHSIYEGLNTLVYVDFVKAKALFAIKIKAILPSINSEENHSVVQGLHPLLFLHNLSLKKKTVPLSLNFNPQRRLLIISGPNAGGKTVALKTIGLLQLMLQSGLLVSVGEASNFCFFKQVLIEIGDSQSIENELSTYSAKLKAMKYILESANANSLILMDEFGSGTDPELGGAIAEAVLESLSALKCKGIITSHFSSIKLLAEKLEGCINGCMLFDLETLNPKYSLSIGEPGSSYTFEVAEKVGFPLHILNRAKDKVDKQKIKLNTLLADVQNQKAKLQELQERAEHEEFMKKMAKEKYHVLFETWQQKLNSERERKIELARLASFGEKYLRLMDDWNFKKDRKTVIKKFIDSITAETKKQDLLLKQNKLDKYSKQKIERIKPKLTVGSKVKILNGTEIGVIQKIDNEKVLIQFGILKMTAGMEKIVLVE
jgi:DNA mismatch repair protein MutS2